MTEKEQTQLIARLANTNILTKDFSYIVTKLTESRTCESCKWYDGSHKCNNENSIAHDTSNRVYTYDGCKEDWESK